MSCTILYFCVFLHLSPFYPDFTGFRSITLIARFMGPTWGPSGTDRTQVGPMLALWTLLSGKISYVISVFTQTLIYALPDDYSQKPYSRIIGSLLSILIMISSSIHSLQSFLMTVYPDGRFPYPDHHSGKWCHLSPWQPHPGFPLVEIYICI